MPSTKPLRILFLLVVTSLACNLFQPINDLQPPTPFAFFTPLPELAETPNPLFPATRVPGEPVLTPTPDAPHAIPDIRGDAIEYFVQANDTLGTISAAFDVSVEEIMANNVIPNPDVLTVGQLLYIPAPDPASTAPAFKIIPDSELVNGPVNAYFDVQAYVQNQGGYLASYNEEIGQEFLSGAQIVDRVAWDYSVNPRLLLAVLEYQSNWVSNPNPAESTRSFPVGRYDSWREGLFRQLTWTADNLNRGYYLWKANAAGAWTTFDGKAVPANATINPGTAGVQHMFAGLYSEGPWRQVVSETGFFQTYQNMFGYPFDLAIEPLIPDNLIQPVLQLPFEDTVAWTFTGGPHGGWDNGSAWAALDFAPPKEELGCVQNDAWVVAMADGIIVRADNGAVVQDLDGDGFFQTGWSIFYMHIETRDRVAIGTFVRTGERIGHPSCEGGISTGTHVHLARRYNGEWIETTGATPFVMDDWVPVGTGVLYDGYMQRGDQQVEACQCKDPGHQVGR